MIKKEVSDVGLWILAIKNISIYL